MKRGGWYILLGLVVLVGSLAAIGKSYRASAAQSQPEVGLRMAPIRNYPVQNPGETTQSKFKLTNLTDKTQKVSFTSEKFKVLDEEYNYAFSPDQSKWIKFSTPSVKLAPGQTKKITYQIAVPVNASPGGYYFLVVASSKHSGNSTNITELRRVAGLVYLEVGGEIIHKTNILTFDVPWFTLRQNLATSVRLANQGNTHDRNRVAVNTRYWPFGKVTEGVQLEGLTLPETVRKLSGMIKLGAIPGVYKLEATFSPPQGGTVHIHRYVLFLPRWFAGALLIAVVLYGVYYLWQNRHKIKQM
jgi:hypothetical protein